MTYQISLLPLTSELHGDALQEVYANAPSYWAMYNLPAVPAGQAMRDLREAEETAGRTMMGIIKPIEDGQPAAGGELIGLVDFRLHWPGARMAWRETCARPTSRRCSRRRPTSSSNRIPARSPPSFALHAGGLRWPRAC